MVPSTLREGAVACRTVAREGSATARRVMAIPVPHDVPPEALSEVHDAANQLQRSAIAAERQAIFLLQCAHRGVLADGPFGSFGDITLPALLSPWAMPAGPQEKHRKAGGLLGVLEGAGEELLATGEGLAKTGVALSAHELDHIVPGLSDHIPYVGDIRKQFDRGVAFAIEHPEEFIKLLGEDTIAAKQWRDGDYANAIGHNIAGLAELFVAVGKVGKAGVASRGATKAEEKAAQGVRVAEVRQSRLVRGRAGSRLDQAPGVTPNARHWTEVAHDGHVRLAAERIETARQNLAAAQAASAHASEHIGETAKEVDKASVKIVRDGSGKVLNEPAEPDHPERGL